MQRESGLALAACREILSAIGRTGQPVEQLPVPREFYNLAAIERGREPTVADVPLVVRSQ